MSAVSMLPNGREGRLYGGCDSQGLVLQGKNAEEMCKKARKVIASRLPPSEVA